MTISPILPPARRVNLARLLAPKSIAFIGGANAEYAVYALSQHDDFKGEVYAVHPKREKLGRYICYKSIRDLPQAPDAVYLAVPAEATVDAVRELREVGAGGVVVYASGFSELGEAGVERNRELIEAAGDLALVGPNCYGIVNYANGGSIWSSEYLPGPGRRGAAIVGQSGNVCIHLSSSQRSVPFSYLISAGNQAVLGFEDYIDYLIDDPQVTCIGLFMEGIRNVPAFSQACLRAREQGMPVIVCRSGISDLGAALAVSHTSSLAGQNEFYDALFRRLGVIVTDTVPQFLEMLKLASLAPRFAGKRLAVFSSSGGDNGLAADFCSLAGLELPQPNAAQVEAIKAKLPDYAHVSNPLDFTAGYWGQEELLRPMFASMLGDGYDAGMMVMDHPPLSLGEHMGEPIIAMLRALAAAGKETGKPVVMASVNPESIPLYAREWMLENGVIPLQGLHDAGPVLAKWAAYSAMLAADAEKGLPVAPYALPDAEPVARTINEYDSKQLLAAYGLPIPQGRVLSIEEALNTPPMPEEPVVLKVLHDDLAHKTEVGGVSLNLRTAEDIRAAAGRMVASVREHAPGVTLDRFLMEPMQASPLAELIVGVKRDPLFGMVLVVGAGGVLVELLADARQMILPVTREEIEAEVRQLRSFVLLDGFRGKPRADIGKVVDAIAAVAGYAADHLDSLVELDVNPLMIYPDGAVAVDALIIGEKNEAEG
ncbi:MAG: acetate--CoA ligase family protein [Sphingobium sp.]